MWINTEAAARKVYCALPGWDVSEVTSLRVVFHDEARFDSDLSRWTVFNVTSLYGTFAGAAAFRGVGVDRWAVGKVATLHTTFQSARVFDANLSSWETSSVTSLGGTFNGAVAFRGAGASTWKVGKVANFEATFQSARVFDANLASWETSSATSLDGTFRRAEAFRGAGMSTWKVSRVKTFEGTFQGASVFDANLASWQTSTATSLGGTFNGAASFRGVGVHIWDVANVANFHGTFRNAPLFDADLSTSSGTSRGRRPCDPPLTARRPSGAPACRPGTSRA